MDIPKLPELDPTLREADDELVFQASLEQPRSYLGMSQIGESCERKSWYRFRMVKQEVFDAPTLKRFADGHRTEALVIERLKMLKSLTLIDIDPATGKQIGFVDCNGHFRGHADGSIIGLVQAPKALHVFEVKCTSEKKFNELKKIVRDIGEKQALKKWNEVYHGQAQLYCHYMDAPRHYMVVATPGGRDWMGVRTNADLTTALHLKAKANRVINSNEPLDKVSKDASWFECRFCAFSGICHENEMPTRNCRSCAHSTPVSEGRWLCGRWGKHLTLEEQLQGCPAHVYLPPLVPGTVVEATEKSVTYKMPDGSTWIDGEVPNV